MMDHVSKSETLRVLVVDELDDVRHMELPCGLGILLLCELNKVCQLGP